MLQIAADTHCHTIASDHAYSTLLENVSAAAALGLKALAITDHGPAMSDAPHPWYYLNLANVIPREISGVKILRGAEANIIDHQGTLDFEEGTIKRLDWIIASIHSGLCPTGSVREITDAYTGAAKNPHVDVIGHSGLADYAYDYEYAVKVFKEYNTLVEINQNSFRVRKAGIRNCIEIARLCKKHRVPVIVNSDAHIALDVGLVPQALQMLEDIGFPEELIVNADQQRFFHYLSEKKNICF